MNRAEYEEWKQIVFGPHEPRQEVTGCCSVPSPALIAAYYRELEQLEAARATGPDGERLCASGLPDDERAFEFVSFVSVGDGEDFEVVVGAPGDLVSGVPDVDGCSVGRHVVAVRVDQFEDGHRLEATR